MIRFIDPDEMSEREMVMAMSGAVSATERRVCWRCGQPEAADIHGKAYGSGSYTGRYVDGKLEVIVETGERYHAPWQHPFEPAMLIRR